MPNPQYLTFTSTTVTTVNLDYRQRPFATAVSVTGSSSGTFTYGINYSLVDPQYTAGIGSSIVQIWLADANLASGSSNGTTNYLFPIAAIQFTLSAVSSAVVLLSVLQGGP